MTDEYYDIDFRQKHPTVKGYWVQADKFTEMYRKAIAFDKIRAEIEQKIIKRPYMDFKEHERWHNDAILEVLDIIDKYKKKE